jgi:hypothetical protein
MILEKALIALLNQEKDKADALFHDFILERSRQIHESLRQGEDFILDESMEETMSIDEMFSDDDLAEDFDGDEEVVAEEGDDEFAADAGDDLAADDVEAGAEGGAAGAEGGADDADVEGEEEDELPIEDRVTDLEADLQRLSAEFDAMMDQEGIELDVDANDEQPVEEAVVQISTTDSGEINVVASTDDENEWTDNEDFSSDVAPMGDDQAAYPMAADGMGDDLGDDFDDLSESIVDELERVTVATGDGREQGNGKFKQNTQSILKNTPVDQRAFKGKPVQIKADEHNGYDREQAPSVKTAEKRQNVKAKSTDGRAAVKKEGDSAAILNKLSADPAGQKSLLGSKK